MNYQKIYNNLIERAQRTLIHGYSERHHIIPKCMGGNNDPSNICILTAEEHYVAHQLLVKIYSDNRKLLYAANLMTKNLHGNRPNNKLYGWLRQRLSNDKAGRPRSKETKEKIRQANIGKRHTEETKLKLSNKVPWNKGLKGQGAGKVMSESTKEKLRSKAVGRILGPLSSEHRENVSLGLKGKPWSEARRLAQENRNEKL